MIFHTILLWITLSMAPIHVKADDKSAFCGICKCIDESNTKINVTCDEYIGNILQQPNSWISSDTNKSFDFYSVTVENSPILSLDQQFPQSDVVFLNLANNSIVNISDSVFANLQSMETLILSYNNIVFLHPKAFYGKYLQGDVYPLKSLINLHLDHNKIHSLDSDAFEYADRVKVLSLSHNPLTVIDHNTEVAITNLVYLERLDLSYTGLSDLPEYFMHTPKYLSNLDLSGNTFTKVPETLVLSHSLSTLYMNSNLFVNITSENGFPNISTLKSLHLNAMSNLQTIGKGALSNLSNLEELYIFNNIELYHLDQDALSAKRDGAEYNTWPPLSKLYIQNNKLTRLDMQFFMQWKNLKDLDMTDNPWTCECENQWMIDELMPIYLAIDEKKAKSLRCAAPIEMASMTFFEISERESTMRCLDRYGNRPERDGVMLVGVLAGVLTTIPIILFIIYAYQRHWFGIFDNSPASYSRQFYRRTVSNEDYF